MNEITSINIENKNYPKLLKKIKQRPETIFTKGNIMAEENCFAIVGARQCTPYGKQVAADIAGALSEAGLTIVSGLAPGIDTAAHYAVVERKERTIAVLGTGIDEKSIYPQTNLKLAEKILETGGCLISEYPQGTRGTKFTFPQRNRIISGLSLGVLVVEAKEKSGALITASWAKSQGRKIFAVPGSIYSSVSKGPNNLIKNGARLVESANDILEALKINTLFPETKRDEQGETNEETLILKSLREGGLTIDKIIEKTKLPAAAVASTLAILEIKDKIKNLEGNIFALKR